MATMIAANRSWSAKATIPRGMRQKVQALIGESYAFMDSPIFQQKDIESELFDFEKEPDLPMVGWYQPTRDEAVDETMAGAPQLMKPAEERIMFLRFNYSKLRLCKLQRLIKSLYMRSDQFIF